MYIFSRCRSWSLLLFYFGMISYQMTAAQSSSYIELQAAYLYNFAKYIRWPEEKDTFNIGIVGDNEEVLLTLTSVLKDKKVGGRAFAISTVSPSDTLRPYQILFLPSEASHRLADVIKLVQNKNVLIVTENDLIDQGATISFLVKDNKLHFKLWREGLKNEVLVASPGLLKLAILI